jgi:hypothetical protein
MTLVANSGGLELESSEVEQRVWATGVPSAQDAIRKRLIAAAVII